jgi:DNA-binding MarR family transcriptional regulator
VIEMARIRIRYGIDPVFPNISVAIIKKILIGLYEKGGSCHTDELADAIQIKSNSISNMLPILKDLAIIERKAPVRGYLVFTMKGRELVKNMMINNKENVKSIFKDLLPNSQTLIYANQILNSLEPNKDITNKELGKKVYNHFGRKGKSDIYYKVIGRSLIGIINLFTNGLQTISKKRKNFGSPIIGIIRAEMTKERMIRVINESNENGIIDFEIIDPKLKPKTIVEISNLVDLHLIELISDYKFQLTDLGLRLKESEKLDNEKKMSAFQEVLIKNKACVEVINRIKNEGYEKVDREIVSRIINNVNGLNWKTGTMMSHGRKFLNWLKNAGLVEETKRRGNYNVSSDLKRISPMTTFQTPSIQKIIKLPIQERITKKIEIPQIKHYHLYKLNTYICDFLVDETNEIDLILIEQELENIRNEGIIEPYVINMIEREIHYALKDNTHKAMKLVGKNLKEIRKRFLEGIETKK